MPTTEHVHGAGKRWDGTRYTCSECRDIGYGWHTALRSVTEALLELNDAYAFAAHQMLALNRALREAEQMRRRRRLWGV